MKFCQKCGTPLDPIARFCGNCGTKVPADEMDVDTQPVKVQSAFTDAAPPAETSRSAKRGAGWYEDPENFDQRRYWDGGWTNKTLPLKRAPKPIEARNPGFYPDPQNPNQRRLWNDGWQAKTLPNPPSALGPSAESLSDASKAEGYTPHATSVYDADGTVGGWKPTTSLAPRKPAAGNEPTKGGREATSAGTKRSGARPVLLVLGGLAIAAIATTIIWSAVGGAGSNEASSDTHEQGSVGATWQSGISSTPTPKPSTIVTPTATIAPAAPVATAAPAAPVGPAPSTAPALSPCNQAMAAAAAVPLSRTNDDEFATTLSSCGSVAEWESALIRYPKAAGLTSVSHADVPLYLSAACYFGPSSNVCLEAERSGFINQ